MKYTHSKIRSFTDLSVWKGGHTLILDIYKNCKTFPVPESYFLQDQMKRASTSVTSNIAEGFGRRTYKDKLRFYYQANGSLTELKDQLLIVRDLHYLSEEAFENLAKTANQVHQLLRGLINKTEELI